MKQLEMLAKHKKAFGGELMKRRRGRLHGRPLATRTTMHLVLRSSKAVGEWSFKKKESEINEIVDKFATKYGVRIISSANVGNHLHFHIKLASRFTYMNFIRAITGAIAMAVSGRNRWNSTKEKLKFWDYRPFTRIVESFRAFLNLRDYIQINQLEGYGCPRGEAVYLVKYYPP